MSDTALQVPVGILVAERSSRARVFEKYGIDYCCGGKTSLAQAAADAGVEVATLLNALRASDEEHAGDDTNWLEVPLVDLCKHIVAKHHTYLVAELPRLAGLTEKIARVHGENHAELLEVADVYAAIREDLDQHMVKEERVLFPLVEELAAAKSRPSFHCGSVQNPIGVMEMEHDAVAEGLDRLRKLTNGYVTPEDGCNTYRATMDGLAQFENDLHEHIHKENSVLFPRAVALEASLSR